MNEQGFVPPEAEQFHPDERLPEDEAHLQANMVKELLGKVPDATPQDYDNAVRTIEELQQAAKDESTFKKISMKILRGATTGTLNLISALTAVVGGYGSPDDIPDARILIDAERKLQLLKQAAEKRGQLENKQFARKFRK